MTKQAKTVYVVCFNCWRQFEHKRLLTVCPKCKARGRMRPMNKEGK